MTVEPVQHIHEHTSWVKKTRELAKERHHDKQVDATGASVTYHSCVYVVLTRCCTVLTVPHQNCAQQRIRGEVEQTRSQVCTWWVQKLCGKSSWVARRTFVVRNQYDTWCVKANNNTKKLAAVVGGEIAKAAGGGKRSLVWQKGHRAKRPETPTNMIAARNTDFST